jgi:hypothetical protein
MSPLETILKISNTVKGDGHTIALSGLNQCVDDEVIIIL